MRFPSRVRTFSLLLAILLAAFALRMYRLDYVPLRGDESFTVLFVEKPFAQMWNEIRTVEPNPPLLYLLLRGWVGLVGDGEFATRYFSAFWGVLCVALIYRLAREIFALPPSSPSPALRAFPPSPSPALRVGDPRSIAEGRRAGVGAGGVIAAFLLAINPYQIWHSQDVRNYTLWPALSLLALVFFWRWRNALAPSQEASRSRAPARYLLFFVLAELAALYTHYYEAFIWLALNLYVLAYFWRRRAARGWQVPALWQWIGAPEALAALYLPWVLIFSNRAASYGEGSGEKGVALWDIWQRTFSSFTLGETLDAAARGWLWIPPALALAAVLLWRWRRERRGLFFLLYAGIPTLAVFGLNLARPLFLERYLNGIAPAYYLLFACGIGALLDSRPAAPTFTFWLRRGLAALALAAFSLLALVALANYFYVPAYLKSPDWRGLARAIEAQSQPGDIILQNFPETSLVYYDRSRLPLVVYPQEFLPNGKTTSALFSLNSHYRRVWFVPAAPDVWDPDHFVQAWLDRHDDLLSETPTGDLRASLYSTPSQFLHTLRPAPALVGNFAALLGFRLERRDPTLLVVLYWRAQAGAQSSYKVFVRLVAAGGHQVLAQTESIPVAGSYPTDQWRTGEIIVDRYELPFTPAAEALSVGMRDPATAAPLTVTGSAGDPSGGAILIPLTTSP